MFPHVRHVIKHEIIIISSLRIPNTSFLLYTPIKTLILTFFYIFQRDNECQDECVAIAGPPPFLIPTLTAPTLEPIVLQLNEEGLYGITLPNVTIDRESGSGSDVTLIGSGSNDVIAYTVRINQLGNNTYVYFPMVSYEL